MARRHATILILLPLLLILFINRSESARRSYPSFFPPERRNDRHRRRRHLCASPSVDDVEAPSTGGTSPLGVVVRSVRGGGDDDDDGEEVVVEEEGGGGKSSNVRTMTSLARIRAAIESSSESDDDDVLVVLDFASRNCPPCEMIRPMYDELSVRDEFVNRRVLFLAVNVSDHPDAAAFYDVDGWPTFLLFRNGIVVDRVVGGSAAREKLYGMISKHSS